MRWSKKPLKEGNKKEVYKFLLKPMYLDEEWRWLEWAWVEYEVQTRMFVGCACGDPVPLGLKWHPIHWIEK
jgi:hypothetical protein